MEKLAKAFGEVLAGERKKVKLSQEDLAIKSEIDRTYISDLENGKYQPSLKTIFKLSKQLQVEPETLIEKVNILMSKK